MKVTFKHVNTGEEKAVDEKAPIFKHISKSPSWKKVKDSPETPDSGDQGKSTP